jgi:ribosomal protein L37E
MIEIDRDKERDMTEYMRCKACGYIMEASKLKDKCPACGVPAAQFEAYKPRMSEKRKRILDLHAHPVLVHFPQAFATGLVILALLLAFLGDGPAKAAVLGAARCLSLALPLFVLAAFAAGLLDGKIRFRKLRTPILVRKIVIGVLFFAFSLGGAAYGAFTSLEAGPLLPFALLEFLSLGAGTALGLLGSGLLDAGFPG